jgi:hypothetical protein
MMRAYRYFIQKPGLPEVSIIVIAPNGTTAKNALKHQNGEDLMIRYDSVSDLILQAHA